jgi:3-dehydroquinate synthase
LIDELVCGQQERLLARFGLPPRGLAWPNPTAMLALMRNDKKTLAGRLRFVLPRRLGEVALIDDVPEDEVFRVLDEYTPRG